MDHSVGAGQGPSANKVGELKTSWEGADVTTKGIFWRIDLRMYRRIHHHRDRLLGRGDVHSL